MRARVDTYDILGWNNSKFAMDADWENNTAYINQLKEIVGVRL